MQVALSGAQFAVASRRWNAWKTNGQCANHTWRPQACWRESTSGPSHVVCHTGSSLAHRVCGLRPGGRGVHVEAHEHAHAPDANSDQNRLGHGVLYCAYVWECHSLSVCVPLFVVVVQAIPGVLSSMSGVVVVWMLFSFVCSIVYMTVFALCFCVFVPSFVPSVLSPHGLDGGLAVSLAR